MRKISTIKVENRINRRSAWQRIEKRQCLKHLISQCWTRILTRVKLLSLAKFSKSFAKFSNYAYRDFAFVFFSSRFSIVLLLITFIYFFFFLYHTHHIFLRFLLLRHAVFFRFSHCFQLLHDQSYQLDNASKSTSSNIREFFFQRFFTRFQFIYFFIHQTRFQTFFEWYNDWCKQQITENI